MKKITLAAVVITTALLLPHFSHLASASGHTVIDGKEYSQMKSDGSTFTVVDVREPRLFKKGHIEGAINIPYDGAHDRVADELSPENTILFVCHGGPMGDKLADILIEKEFKKVYNLKGGMRAWRGPVVK